MAIFVDPLELERLNKLCAERKEAEDSLKKKWKKIEEFDACRSELETIYTALLKANVLWDGSSHEELLHQWNQMREFQDDNNVYTLWAKVAE
nr:augmin subunit 5 [Quercus suber]